MPNSETAAQWARRHGREDIALEIEASRAKLAKLQLARNVVYGTHKMIAYQAINCAISIQINASEKYRALCVKHLLDAIDRETRA